MPQIQTTPHSLHFNQVVALTRISALSALGDRKGLRTLFSGRSFRNVPRAKVEEALLETHLFAGFPATIEAFIELRRVAIDGKRHSSVTRRDTRGDRRLRGRAVCRSVYGGNYDRLINRMKSLHPVLSDWIIEDGYGKVLSRPGLSLIEREFVAMGALAACGWVRQFKSHVKGIVNLGVEIQTVSDVFRKIEGIIPITYRKEVGRILVAAGSTNSKRP